MMLTDLANVLRNAGLQVVEVGGWKSRGNGIMHDVRGVTCHHTAHGGAPGNAPSLGVVRDGRPGLDGPLAHLVLGVDGTFYVVAAGLCYHAGISRKSEYTNSHRIGIEAEAKGTGVSSDWPKKQMDAYVIGCAALSEFYNFDVNDILGHKETCDPPGRKSDPSFNMSAFRKSVQEYINRPTEDEDEMNLKDKIEVSQAVANHLGDPGIKAGDEISVEKCILWGFVRATEAEAKVEALTEEFRAYVASQSAAAKK